MDHAESLLARSRRVEVTGPRGADGSLRANRFGSVATSTNSSRADGAYWVLLPDAAAPGAPDSVGVRVAVGLEHLALESR